MRKLDKSILFVIILLGAFLRLYRLGFQGIWLDEAHTWLMASKGPVWLWREQIFSASPPLYFIFMHYWINLLGKSAFIMRLPSAISGIISIPIVYYIGRKMFDGKTALISSFLVAISCPHIYYSQEARCYVMLAISSLISGFYFYQMLLDDNKKTRLSYVIATLLCLYLHNYGIFIWLAQFLYLFFKGFLRETKFLIIQLIILLIFSPRIIIFMQQIQMDISAFLTKPGLIDFFHTFARLVFLSRNLPLFALTRVVMAINVFLFLFIFVIAFGRTKGPQAKFSLSICTWHLAIPIVIPFFISFFKPIYLPGRYEFISYLFFILIIGKGISVLTERKILYPVLTIIVFSALVCLPHYFFVYSKCNTPVLNDYIKKHVRGRDIIIFTNLAILPYRYYFGKDIYRYVFPYPEGEELLDHPKEVIEEREDFAQDEAAKINQKITPLMRGDRRLFLFFNSGMKIDRMLVNRFRKKYNLEEEISFHERDYDKFEIMKVMVFRKE